MTAAAARAMDLTISLSDPRASDPSVVGHKAARLSTLLAAGFDVPSGSVLPADTCARWPQASDSLVAGLAGAQSGPLAVRSSAVAEDLAGASFAGMYATCLDVQGASALREAIAEVIDSAHADRVRAYHCGDPKMAVLVQRQVPAESAGVAFTADPITGRRDVVVIHAVRGLGEGLVSGREDPEEWSVGAEPTCGRARNVLTEAQAGQIAELARRVEAHEGEPRDIEWAFAEGKLWLLQCRPITALPVEPEMPEPPTGVTWMKDAAHFAEPVSPFGFSTYIPALETGMREAFAEFGLLIEGLEVHNRGHEVYGRPVPVGGKDGPAPPALLIGLLARVIPPLRKRMRAARDAFRGGKLESVPRQWNDTLRDRFQQDIDGLLEEDLSAMESSELVDHLGRARDLLVRGQIAHFRLFMPYVVGIGELGMGCQQLLGWEPAQTMRLVTGLSAASSAPTRALAALADHVREREDLQEALASMREIADLDAVDADFAEAFRAFERRHGWRTTAYDPGSATLAERPQLLVRLILDQLRHGSAEDDAKIRAEAEAEAKKKLRGRPDDLQCFEALLDAARRIYPIREDNIALTDNFPCGMLRRALLEAGKRLAAAGRIGAPGQARYLTFEELVDALSCDHEQDLRSLVERRHAEERWVLANPGPPRVGPAPHEPPDPRWLPAEGRRMNRAMMWFMDQELAPPEQSTGATLRGRSGSAGRVQGTVKVLRSEVDFHKLTPGDVLVCPITSPVWSVLFANAAALVTDAGGAMSHAAIVAREHGIPAVLATGDATIRLQDGDQVIVDGTAGVVTVLER